MKNLKQLIRQTVSAILMLMAFCTTMQAHYFIFLFTVFGQMTPPVAVTAVAAAPLCRVSYLRAGIEAVKCGCQKMRIQELVVTKPSANFPLFSELRIHRF